MDIHKPKPMHSIREFLLEIFVIVLGITIALGAEQVVEKIHWEHKVREAESAIRLELQDANLPQASARLAVARCLDDRLLALETAVEAGTDRKTVADLADAYVIGNWTWDSEAWKLAIADDLGAHASAEQMIQWSLPYRYIPRLDALNAQEYATLPELRALRYGRGPVSPGEAERLLVTAEKLRGFNRSISDLSAGVIHHAAQGHIAASSEISNRLIAQLRTRFDGCVMDPKAAFDSAVAGTLLR